MVYEKKKCVKNTFENSEKRKKNTLKLKNVLTNETSTGKREKLKKSKQLYGWETTILLQPGFIFCKKTLERGKNI